MRLEELPESERNLIAATVARLLMAMVDDPKIGQPLAYDDATGASSALLHGDPLTIPGRFKVSVSYLDSSSNQRYSRIVGVQSPTKFGLKNGERAERMSILTAEETPDVVKKAYEADPDIVILTLEDMS